MPPWVQDGGLEAWIERLKDPATRAARDRRDARRQCRLGEPLRGRRPRRHAAARVQESGAEAAHRQDARRGRAERGVSPEDAAIDLVIEDGSRVGVAYFLMSEDNIRREVALPWVSFDSDADAPAPEGVFLKSSRHPRAYGNFARVLAKYVRDEHVLTLRAGDPQARRRCRPRPCRSRIAASSRRATIADVVVFDPNTIQDHATYEKPQQLATGRRRRLGERRAGAARRRGDRRRRADARCAAAPGAAPRAAAAAPVPATGPGASESRQRAATAGRATRPLVCAGAADARLCAQHRRPLLDLDADRADPHRNCT